MSHLACGPLCIVLEGLAARGVPLPSTRFKNLALPPPLAVARALSCTGCGASFERVPFVSFHKQHSGQLQLYIADCPACHQSSLISPEVMRSCCPEGEAYVRSICRTLGVRVPELPSRAGRSERVVVRTHVTGYASP